MSDLRSLQWKVCPSAEQCRTSGVFSGKCVHQLSNVLDLRSLHCLLVSQPLPTLFFGCAEVLPQDPETGGRQRSGRNSRDRVKERGVEVIAQTLASCSGLNSDSGITGSHNPFVFNSDRSSKKMANHTEVREFIFQGFSNFHEHQLTLFIVFLIVYILTLAGNVIIVTVICIDHHLHTPMYFFLSILSTSETFYSLVIIPRMLSGLVGLSQSISLVGCGTQLFFFLGFAITNCFLLAVMGFDRYVAICNPLRYSVIVNWRVCTILASSVGTSGFLLSLIQAVAIFTLSFCNSLIEHFFCDVRPVLALACAAPILNDILTLIITLLALTAPSTFLFISYILIISTILKIASAEGRKKAFATCASHLTVVIVHYGCASISYFKPKSEDSRDQDLLISMTYTILTPLLNPVVYSLRNKEVQDALRRLMGRKSLP
ncbi:olfactory receptor 10J1-like [Meles meles]|uniref:olfactory receptor 10J1-like n=1 Tax=Meles meles TaxID=9662 RepID=UPI001E69A97C|nr:olfactory receptor 10J1-like [Meles meles]